MYQDQNAITMLNKTSENKYTLIDNVDNPG